MPIYEYVCEKCGKYHEAMQRMADPALTECPSCHAQALTKQISAAGFRLKGGGWYETDFKSDGKRNIAESGGTSEAKASSEAPACGAGACPACVPPATTTH